MRIRWTLLAAISLAALSLNAFAGQPASAPSTRPVLSKANPELIAAIQGGFLRRVTRLIDAGVSVNAAGDSPLFYATQAHNVQIVTLLLKRGADPNSTDHCGAPSILIAANRKDVAIVKALLDAGASKDLGFALRQSVSNDDLPTMRLLIAHRADVNFTSLSGVTLLHLAAMDGRLETVKLLLESGADRKIKDLSGRTAEDHARARQREQVAKIIAEFKAPSTQP